MSADGPMNPTVFDRLQAAWEEQGVGWAGHLAPGLPEAETRARFAEVGLEVPPEAVQWWSWANGVAGATTHQMIDISWAWASVDHAVHMYRVGREIAHEVEPENPDRVYPVSLLPVFVERGSVLGIDLALQGRPTFRAQSHDVLGPYGPPLEQHLEQLIELYTTRKLIWRADLELWDNDIGLYGPRRG